MTQLVHGYYFTTIQFTICLTVQLLASCSTVCNLCSALNLSCHICTSVSSTGLRLWNKPQIRIVKRKLTVHFYQSKSRSPSLLVCKFHNLKWSTQKMQNIHALKQNFKNIKKCLKCMCGVQTLLQIYIG